MFNIVTSPAAPNSNLAFYRISDETIDNYALGLSQLHEQIRGKWREPDFWRWCYLQNPVGSGTTIATRNDRVVGKLGSIYSTLSVNGHNVKASLLEGFEVLSEERSWQCFRGILAGCIEAGELDEVAFGYGFATKSSARLNQKIGWSSLGQVPVNAAFLDLRKALEERSFPSALARLGHFLNPLLRVSPRRLKGKVEGYDFRPIRKFESCFDELWDSVKESRTVTVVKDARYLNWRYLNCPGREHECWALYQKDRLKGWVVFRTTRKLREGCVLDLVAHKNDPEILSIIVRWTLRQFVLDCVGLVRASFPIDSPEGSILRRIGFHSWTSLIARIELGVTGAGKEGAAVHSQLKMGNWHFSLGDWLYY